MPDLWDRAFPLDEALGLLPGALSPRLKEALTRLGTWVPSFERAATELAYFTQVAVSDTTVRRHPEASGAAYVAVQAAEVERLEQLQYAHFRAQGYPIGSGSVESATAEGAAERDKLVIEARLNGSGMHRAREHVNPFDPLAALRTVVCSDRWAEAWP